MRVGTIAIRTGTPPGEDPWGRACGFYPGSHPRECTDGSAATFDQARADFEEAWVCFCRTGPMPTFRSGAMNAIGPSANMRWWQAGTLLPTQKPSSMMRTPKFLIARNRGATFLEQLLVNS